MFNWDSYKAENYHKNERPNRIRKGLSRFTAMNHKEKSQLK